MVIRFAPTEGGQWTFRLTSNVAALNDQTGTFTASDSDAPGFIKAANMHHWSYTERLKPHLWMGDSLRLTGKLADAGAEYSQYLKLSDFDSKFGGKLNYYVLGSLFGMGRKSHAHSDNEHDERR